MDDQLTQYTDDHFWAHLTLPSILDSIDSSGIELGHPTTEEQIFSEYFPNSGDDEVVDVRQAAETLLERVRDDIHGDTTFASRRDCVALWPSVEQAYQMRSSVLGDSIDYGVVIVDARQLESPKMVLSEYQFVAQAMMHVSQHRSEETEISSDELVEPAWNYWKSATLTNSWEAVLEQASMFELPEVLVNSGVSSDAIVETLTLSSAPYDDDDMDAPPEVTPE